ncbi:MAG TPA: sigma-70 region 4 domain-containing protein [Allosphingosinicella sp.]|jgi:RNA polymerase sigma factor (sigma-70 family)|uniref:sigma-70 region 4 domain-containing protein n=1 Tax=Allosphingosinicella sp. TaxID=2823234 RepID=UPI002F2A5F89
MPKLPRKPGLDQLERAASKLRPIEQEVLFLSAREGLAYDEIAVQLGISSDEVRSHLTAALYRLDRELERQARPWWRFW